MRVQNFENIVEKFYQRDLYSNRIKTDTHNKAWTEIYDKIYDQVFILQFNIIRALDNENSEF